MVSAGFSAFGESVTYTPQGGGDSVAALAIIDRGAEVLDDYGVLVDSRIEIDLRVSEVPDPGRGDVIAVGDDSFQLFQRITDNGISQRWVVNEV